MQTHAEATVLCQRIGYILDNESPRGYARSFISWKALRWTRILIRVDQRSKTTSHKKTVFEYSVIRKTSDQSWFLVYQRVLPQACLLQHPWHLQGRKFIIPSLPQARLPQHPWHLQRRLIIQIILQQSYQAKVWIDKYGETRILLKRQKSCWINQPKSQKMRITNRYGETRVIPTYRNGCKSSQRILWMTEFLNAETHTRVLLMNHL